MKIGVVAMTGGCEGVFIYLTKKMGQKLIEAVDQKYSISERAADWGRTVVDKFLPTALFQTVTR